MDRTNEYILRCKTAIELQELKKHKGFYEGDVIVVSNGSIKVLASDFLAIRQKYKGEDTYEFYFAMLETETTSKIQYIEDKLELRQGKYIIREFDNPIWLPRQDQLEAVFYKRYLKEIDPEAWISELKSALHLRHMGVHFGSVEQVALSVIMNIGFEKIWSSKSHNWVS